MIILSNDDGVIAYDKEAIIASNVSIPSPVWETDFQYTGNQMGVLPTERRIKERPITVRFILRADDFSDSLLLRDEFYRLITREDYFYLQESRQTGKRWKVIFNGMTEPTRHNQLWYTVDVELIAFVGVSESIGTTLTPLEYDVNKWQFGQGLTFEDKKYIHSENVFTIYNAGDISIDPRKVDLEITFIGNSNNLKIINHTNDTVWQYNGSTTKSDKIAIKGIESFKNNASIFSQTNKKLITLVKGNNEIEIQGATDFTISFDFNFYYL